MSDAKVRHIMNTLLEREKTYTSFVEKFSSVNDLTNSLSSCHYNLNKTIEALEKLNNFLHIDDRLEPFVWTTG
jgi:hypothetical protein